MKKNLLKKTAALALSASMLLSMTASAFAAGIESGSPTETLTATVTQPGTANNEELFDQYVEGLFYGGVQTYSTTHGRDRLDAELQAAYTTLLSKIKKIASGDESRTEFTNLNIKITAASEDDFSQKVGKVIDALLLDCSSELYWYDKTAGTEYGYTISGNSYTLPSFSMQVASSYRGADEYTTDLTKISAANKAVKNAENIANKAPSGTAEKLKYFKDKICNLVSYDTAAAKGGAYGDSFQLTNVFDGDSKTNVVCEGYSKAFSYLCELADIECYTVTGTMSGGTGAGPHMWNLVRLDGKSYVVDVTNCDTGTIGAPDKLFLKGVELTSNGYKVGSVTYTYDSDTTSMLSSDVLTPSTTDYGAPSHTHTFSDEWTFDETYHWHAATCEHKDEISDKAAHKWDDGKITTQPTETSKGVKTFTCTTCKATKTEEVAQLEHTHTFSDEWSKDDTYHWHAATCGHDTEISGKEAHKWDDGKITTQPTETSKGVKTFTCTTCKATKTEEVAQLEHTHTFSDEWSKDDTYHWHAATCGHDTETSGKEAHKWDDGKITTQPTETSKGVKTFTCTTCKATKTEEVAQLEHQHTFSEDWKSNNTDHWHECECGEKKDTAKHTEDAGVVTTEPTTESTGVRTYSCTVCKMVLRTETIGKLHEHTFSTKWKSDNTDHWHECECGEKKDTAKHTEDAGVVTTEPTTESTGVRTYSCTVCKMVLRTETMPKLEHQHTMTLTPAKDATCTEAGNIAYNHCSGCNKYFSADGKTEITLASTVINAKGHAMTLTPAKDATCTEAGNIAYNHCSGCNKYFSVDGKTEITLASTVINAKGHAMTLTPAKDATCTEAGNIAYNHCSGCNKYFSADGKTEITLASTVINAKGHAMTLTPAKDATCTEAGNIAYNHCSGCNKYFSADGKTEITLASTVIPAKGHTYPDTWKSDDTNHWKECECGNKSETAAHSWKIETVEPTETAEGKKTSTCTVCGKVITETIPKLEPGHTHTLTLVPEKKATCTETGNLAYYTCTCGKWFTDPEGTAEINDHNSVILLMISHNVSTDWSHDDGFHWHTCSGCDGKLDFTPHTWDNGVITTQPTEEKDGVKTYTCAVCKRTKTESVPALQHTHELEYIAAVDPTCSKTGNIAHYHCKKCGKNYSDSNGKNELADITLSINSTNHAGGTEIRGAIKATCMTNGYTGDTYCLGCGTVLSHGKTVYASSSGHSFHNGVCRHCGTLQYSYMYKPTITYLNDTYHFYSGMARLHKPDSHGLYIDALYQWYVCAECGHEYGRTSRWIQTGNDDSGAIDIFVDDPVECGEVEWLFTVR